MKNHPVEGQGGLLKIIEAGANNGFTHPRIAARALSELLRRLCVCNGLCEEPVEVPDAVAPVVEPTQNPEVTTPPETAVITPAQELVVDTTVDPVLINTPAAEVVPAPKPLVISEPAAPAPVVEPAPEPVTAPEAVTITPEDVGSLEDLLALDAE